MKSTEKQDLKKKIRRIGLFLLMVFLPVLVVSVVMAAVEVPIWLNILVLVIILFIMFFLFALVCDKLDRKKTERQSKKKDPFSD